MKRVHEKIVAVVPIKDGAWAISVTGKKMFVAICNSQREAMQGARWYIVFNPYHKLVIKNRKP